MDRKFRNTVIEQSNEDLQLLGNNSDMSHSIKNKNMPLKQMNPKID